MKKLNLRLLLSLVVGTVAVLAGIYLLHRHQIGRICDDLVVRAGQAEKDKNLPEQLRLLQRYLRYRSNDVEQLKRLLAASRSAYEEAPDAATGELIFGLYQPLQAAIRKHPDDVDLRRHGIWYANVGLAESDDESKQIFLNEAMDHFRQLEKLGGMEPKDQITMAACEVQLAKKAEAIARLGDLVGFDPATGTFDAAKAKAPGEITAYASLAEYCKDNTSSTAGSQAKDLPRRVIDQMVQANPESSDAYLTRAEFVVQSPENPSDPASRQQAASDALVDAKKAVEKDPKSDRAVLFAAQLSMWLKTPDYAAAQALLEAGIKEHPDNVAMYVMLAQTAEAQEDLKQAKAYIEQGLERVKLNIGLLLYRANYEIDLNEIDAARQTLARLEQQLGPSRYALPHLELIRGRLLMADGKLREAEQILVRAEQQLQRFDRRLARKVRVSLMECYEKSGQRHLAQKIREQLTESQGNMLEAEWDQAKRLVAQGKLDDASTIYGRLWKASDWTERGRKILFDEFLDLRIQQQLKLPEAQRNWSEVDRIASFWLSRDGVTDVEKEDFRVRLLVKKGKVSEARNRAEELVRQFPNVGPYRMLLTDLTQDSEAALKLLDQVQQIFGDSLTLRLARCERIVRLGGDQVVAKLQAQEKDADNLPLQDQDMLWEGMTRYYEAAGAYDNAIESGRKLLKSRGDNVAIQYFVFGVAEKAGNLAVMEEMQVAIERLAGKQSLEWQLAECRRLTWLVKQGQRDKSTLAEVRPLLEAVRSRDPDLPMVHVLQADVAELEGNASGAIDAMRMAVQKGSGNSRYLHLKRLAELLVQANRTEEASAVLAQLPDGQKDSLQVIQELNILATQDPAATLKRIAELQVKNPDNPDLLKLAYKAQLASGQQDQAMESLRRLTVVQPQVPTYWLGYVVTLKRAGRQAEADKALKDLQIAVSAEKVPFLLGQCYQAMGEPEKAWPYFAQELQKHPDDAVLLQSAAIVAQARNDQAEFTRLIEHIISLDRPDAADDVRATAIWARRTKAQLLASTQSYKDFKAAIALLEQNAGSDGQLSGPDLLIWLQLCAARPEAASRTMAVERLSQVQKQRNLTDDEKAVMAGLFKAAGRWNEAQQIMVDLLTANPNSAGLTSTYIQWLLDENQLTDAAVWIRKLDPQSQAAVRFNAILQVRQGNENEAARQLAAKVPRNLTAENADAARNVLAICEDLGQINPKFYDLAERIWQKYIQVRPEDISVLVGFYSRVPKGAKLDKAFAICEQQIGKAAQDKQPQAVLAYIAAGLDALRLHKKDLPADSPHYERVHQWFDVARQAGANDLELASREIYYYNLRSDLAKLEQLYRDFLNRSDATDLQKAQIRNNLAFLLAISQRGQEALEVIGDAIEELGPRADLLDTRGTAHLSSGNVEAALKDLQAAVSDDDASASMYFHLALAEHKGGKTAEAVTALAKAQSMGLTEADLEAPEVPIYRDLLKDLGPQMQTP